jgi:hypothetical protein
MGPASLARLSLQTTQAIYARLPLKDVRVRGREGGEGDSGVRPSLQTTAHTRTCHLPPAPNRAMADATSALKPHQCASNSPSLPLQLVNVNGGGGGSGGDAISNPMGALLPGVMAMQAATAAAASD